MDPNGSQNGAKNVKKSTKNSIKIRMSFLKGFLVKFWPTLMPKWRQIGTKVEAKTDLNTKTPQLLKCYKNQYFFNNCWVRGDRFENQHRSKINEKTEPMSKCVSTSIFHPFLVHFGCILGAKVTKKAIEKNIEKTTSNKKRAERDPKVDFGPLTFLGGSHFGPRGGYPP